MIKIKMSAFNRLKRKIVSNLYHEETGYYLNYLTLEVSEPEMWEESRSHCYK